MRSEIKAIQTVTVTKVPRLSDGGFNKTPDVCGRTSVFPDRPSLSPPLRCCLFQRGGGGLGVDTSGDLWTGSCDRPPTRLSGVPADDKRAATSWQLTCGTGQSLTRRRWRRLFGILLSADCTELPLSPRFPVKTADSLTFVCLSRLSHRIRAPLNRVLRSRGGDDDDDDDDGCEERRASRPSLRPYLLFI